MNDNLVFLALHFTISKLYAASFLATSAFTLLLWDYLLTLPRS